MGIDSDSSLFVGAYRENIHCSQEVLDDLTDQDYLIRVSPYYDAPSDHCYYGVEISTADIMEDGGIDKIKKLIVELNEKFETTECDLMHSPNIW
jgi:hypothetical protein